MVPFLLAFVSLGMIAQFCSRPITNYNLCNRYRSVLVRILSSLVYYIVSFRHLWKPLEGQMHHVHVYHVIVINIMPLIENLAFLSFDTLLGGCALISLQRKLLILLHTYNSTDPSSSKLTLIVMERPFHMVCNHR